MGMEATQALQFLVQQNIDIIDVLFTALTDPRYATQALLSKLALRLHSLLDVLNSHAVTAEPLVMWSERALEHHYKSELLAVTAKQNGFHFNSKSAVRNDMEGFRIESMGERLQKLAPRLWNLLGVLLSADDKLDARRQRSWLRTETRRKKDSDRQSRSANLDIEMDGDDTDSSEHTAYLSNTSDEDLNDLDSESTDEECDEFLAGEMGAVKRARGPRARRKALLRIVSTIHLNNLRSCDLDDNYQKQVVITSILAKSTNQSCNAFGVLIGFFLHASNTPDRVVKMLAHSGISIAPSAIESTVAALSEESVTHFRELGRTFKAAYGYDNFDIHLNHPTPTAEKGGSVLLHLTNGTLIRLVNVEPDDLLVSNYLWSRSHFNLKRTINVRFGQYRSAFAALKSLHNRAKHASGLTSRQEFQAWKFREDLVLHGPAFFQKFKNDLGMPEVIEQIPLSKMYQVPARAMDIDESKAKGNVDVLEHLFQQANIGSADDARTPGVVDIGDNVIIVHGDLATGERIWSVLASRGIEDTPMRRFQPVIFVPGNFHLLMAATDAIWRVLLQPIHAREDPNCAMEHVGILRPKETGKMGSKPGYRRMHDFIQHDGTALRLDCWRTHLNVESLEEFAAKNPSWEQIVRYSEEITLKYVADGLKFEKQRRAPARDRDELFENMQVRHQLYLLFEELLHSMNNGDIGRLDGCMPTWIFIFKSVGKNKYSSYMTRFLLDLHFVYPAGLR